MAYDGIPIRFTENKYATKLEVSNELKTPMIDVFWAKILEYRKQYSRALPLFSIDKKIYFYCLAPAVANKINDCEMRVINFLSKYSGIKTNYTNDTSLFTNNCYVNICENICKKYNFDVDENYLSMLVNHKIHDNSKAYFVLNNYLSGLQTASGLIDKTINEDTIAEIYSTITNNFELTNLYREKDNYVSHAVINPIFNEAPCGMIEKLMDDFFKFIDGFECSYLVKAAATYYYLNLIKPFDEYNQEMAIIITKLVLAKNNLNDLAFLLPLEEMLINDNQNLEKVLLEVQKSEDLTYFLLHFIEIINEEIMSLLNKMNNLQALELKNDYYAESYKEANLKIEDVKENNVEQKQLKNEIINQKDDSQDVEKEIFQKSHNVETNNELYQGLAISVLPPTLSEKDLQRLEENLLESDPQLKHGQAYFYVRHCTIGKRYTIGQYKKELGCAYETARTSMDLLAKLGYYRQEMVKNKKVYTPIKRK